MRGMVDTTSFDVDVQIYKPPAFGRHLPSLLCLHVHANGCGQGEDPCIQRNVLNGR
jgi:hypothetical protein